MFSGPAQSNSFEIRKMAPHDDASFERGLEFTVRVGL
jgi:hypothetical protein